MSTPTTPTVVSLDQYGRIARRRWRELVLGLAVGAVLGLVWFQVSPRAYEASATVTISPITTELFSGSPVNQLVNTATEVTIVRSTEVARRAAGSIGTSADPRDLLESLTVVVPLDSLALTIGFTADSPDAAAEGANAFAAAYLDFRLDAAERRRATYTEQLSEQLRALNEELSALPDDSADREAIGREIAAVRQQIGDATLLTLNPGELVSQALPPRSASTPQIVIALPAGLILGGVLGVGLAAWRHRRDDRLHDELDVIAVTEVPVLGVLPPVDDRSDVTRLEDRDELDLTARRLLDPVVMRERRGHTWLLVAPGPEATTRAAALVSAMRRFHPVTMVSAAEHHRDAHASPEDAVIVDGGGVDHLAAVVDLASTADETVVVVTLGTTTASRLQRLIGELDDPGRGRHVTGVLLVGSGLGMATGRAGRGRATVRSGVDLRDRTTGTVAGRPDDAGRPPPVLVELPARDLEGEDRPFVGGGAEDWGERVPTREARHVEVGPHGVDPRDAAIPENRVEAAESSFAHIAAIANRARIDVVRPIEADAFPAVEADEGNEEVGGRSQDADSPSAPDWRWP